MALPAGAPSISFKGLGGNNWLLVLLFSYRRCIHLLTSPIVESMLISCHPPCFPCSSSMNHNPSFLSVSTMFFRSFLLLSQPTTILYCIANSELWWPWPTTYIPISKLANKNRWLIFSQTLPYDSHCINNECNWRLNVKHPESCPHQFLLCLFWSTSS